MESEIEKNQRIARILERRFEELGTLQVNSKQGGCTDLETANGRQGIELTKYVRADGRQDIGISLETCVDTLKSTLGPGGYVGKLTAKGTDLLRNRDTVAFRKLHTKTQHNGSSEVLTVERVSDGTSVQLAISGLNVDWVGVNPKSILEIVTGKSRKFDDQYKNAIYDQVWLVIHSPEMFPYDSFGDLQRVRPEIQQEIATAKGPFERVVLLGEMTKQVLVL